MISDKEFVNNTLTTNLYYLRTLREFCARIELSLPSLYKEEIAKAIDLVNRCEQLGVKLIRIADGNISADALNSEIFFTKYTLDLEKLTNKLFEYDINTNITELELAIKPGNTTPTPEIVKALEEINQEALKVASELSEFYDELYDKVFNQNAFTFYYNTLNIFTALEVNFYVSILERLINKDPLDPIYVTDYEYEFNRLLGTVAALIRGECDIYYEDTIQEANNFVIEYGNLINEYETMTISPENQKNMTDNSIELAKRFKIFVENCIEKLLKKELYFISPPITKNNALTDINYFIYNLERFK